MKFPDICPHQPYFCIYIVDKNRLKISFSKTDFILDNNIRILVDLTSNRLTTLYHTMLLLEEINGI